MATEVHTDGAANGTLKKQEVEPLGELKGVGDALKPADLKRNQAPGDVANGCEKPPEKGELLAKPPTSKPLKEVAHDEADEDANDAQDGQEFSSEEDGDADEGDDDVREAEAEASEDDDDEYVDDGEDEEGDEEDDSQPPPKRRK